MCSSAFDKLFAKNVPHILEKIFLSLDYESFKSCMEVSTAWNGFLKSESFKKKAKSMFHKDLSKEEEELWYAVRDGNMEVVRRLLSSGMLDVNSRSHSYGHRTALHQAAVNCATNGL